MARTTQLAVFVASLVVVY